MTKKEEIPIEEMKKLRTRRSKNMNKMYMNSIFIQEKFKTNKDKYGIYEKTIVT